MLDLRSHRRLARLYPTLDGVLVVDPLHARELAGDDPLDLVDTPMLLMMPVARGVGFAITPIVSGLFLAYYYRHDEASGRLATSSNDVLETRDSDTHIILGSSNVRRLQGIPVSFLLVIGLFTMAFGYMQYLTSF